MKARAARLLVLCCITALTAATAASAGRPPFNPVCNGTKIDPVATGTYALPNGSVDILVYDTPGGQAFDFKTDGGIVASVVAKGGTDYATYPVGDSFATGLHAPLNPNTGDSYDLSYLCFTMGGGGVG
jgi:hypothetical protein